MSPEPSVVAFDLDGTLLKGNSSFAHSRYLYQKGVLSLGDLIFCAQTYMHFWIKNLPLMDLHRTVFARLCQGRTLEFFSDHTPNFVAERMSKMLYAPAIAELQKWKEKGAKILLLSSSPDFIVKAIAKALGIDDGYGTQYLVDSQGILTDIGYLIDGPCKARMLKEKTGAHDVTMAYSDHVCDLPFLESVSHPIVVNPERRLKRIARRRGWKIL